MYNVVISADWCSVVPHSWINKDSMSCLWPLNTSNITKAVQKKINPDKSWKSTPVKYILGPYGKNLLVLLHIVFIVVHVL